MDKWPNKDPNEILDYDIEWNGTSTQPGRAYLDPLTDSQWLITGGDGALVLGSSSFSTTATKIWLSGGTLNKQYTITNRVVTTGGRTMDKSALLTIREK